jgi:hypothetical protein
MDEKVDHIVICADDNENMKHVHAVDILAKDLGISADDILSAYRCEFDRLSRQAKIRDFLSIIITRKVRGIVKNDYPFSGG